MISKIHFIFYQTSSSDGMYPSVKSQYRYESLTSTPRREGALLKQNLKKTIVSDEIGTLRKRNLVAIKT